MQNISTTKRWILSTFVTFFSGFALVLIPEMDEITLETFQNGAIVGVLFSATRAGVKALLEAFIIWNNSR